MEEQEILDSTLLIIRRRCIEIEQNKNDEIENGYMRLFQMLHMIEIKIHKLIQIEEKNKIINKISQ